MEIKIIKKVKILIKVNKTFGKISLGTSKGLKDTFWIDNCTHIENTHID